MRPREQRGAEGRGGPAAGHRAPTEAPGHRLRWRRKEEEVSRLVTQCVAQLKVSKVALLLLEHNAVVDRPTKRGRTPLCVRVYPQSLLSIQIIHVIL